LEVLLQKAGYQPGHRRGCCKRQDTNLGIEEVLQKAGYQPGHRRGCCKRQDAEPGHRIRIIICKNFVPSSREYTAAFSFLQPFAHTFHKIFTNYNPYSLPGDLFFDLQQPLLSQEFIL